MSVHELKTWPAFFDAVARGVKTYEIRKADRDFVVGDTLLLREFEPESGTYTGRAVRREVSYMTRGAWGLPADVCVMALRVDLSEPTEGDWFLFSKVSP